MPEFQSLFITKFPSMHMWIVFLTIIIGIALYCSEKFSEEVTSLLIISFLAVFFYLVPGDNGEKIVSMDRILLGFANPALITVLSLLVIGQSLIMSGALNHIAEIILKISFGNKIIAIIISLSFVTILSSVLNNTPVVIIFIPILALMAKKMNFSTSTVMIPLSYCSILGGMITLIGSSTNLLVSGAIEGLGMQPLNIFDFVIPGSVMALVGLFYTIFVIPKILPSNISSEIGQKEDNRKFTSQFIVKKESKFIDKTAKELEKMLEEVTISMIKRGSKAFLVPFDEDLKIKTGDIIIINAKKENLLSFISSFSNHINLNNDSDKAIKIEDDNLGSVVEAILAPSSRLIGKTLKESLIYNRHGCIVLGGQKQSHLIKGKISDLRLNPGDTLLVMGDENNLSSLKKDNDFILADWSLGSIFHFKNSLKSIIIFLSVAILSAFGILPISISSFAGATILIITKSINIRQAIRALDSKIIFIVTASLAMGLALQETGGAAWIAEKILFIMKNFSNIGVIAALFIIMTIFTNILSNNAAAVLFTPIAVNMAIKLGVDPIIFIVAVIFACNCSFITPIGYQTNLLVMGPGHYKFNDYIRAGFPLAILMCTTYCLMVLIFGINMF